MVKYMNKWVPENSESIFLPGESIFLGFTENRFRLKKKR